MKEPKLVILENGLKVIFLKKKEAFSVSLCAVLRAGSKYETEDTIGAAHFFEHMLFEGTKKNPNSKSLAWFLEQAGGKSSAWTDKDYVEYSVRVPKDHFERGLEYLSQILFQPILTGEAVEKEKNIILEEFHRKIDNSEVEVWEIFMEKTFGKDNYLGRSILGTLEAIRKLNVEKLSSFLERYYKPNNIVLIVVGNFAEKDMLHKIREYFGTKNKGEPVIFEKSPLRLSNKKIFFPTSKDVQSQIAIAFITGVRIIDEDLWVFKIIRNILGMGMGSRIMQELVYRQGIAYSTSVWNWNYEETGLFCVSAGVSSQNVRQAVSSILNEFNKIKNGQVTDDELEYAITGETANEYYLHENFEDLALNYGLRFVLQNKIYTLKDIEGKLKSITKNKIIDTASKYFTGENVKCVIKGKVSGDIVLDFV